jgi:hypothetical protein
MADADSGSDNVANLGGRGIYVCHGTSYAAARKIKLNAIVLDYY